MNVLIDGGEPVDDPGPLILILTRDLLLEFVIPELPVGMSAYLKASGPDEIILAFAEQSPGKDYSKFV